jgi:hypothetical protein
MCCPSEQTMIEDKLAKMSGIQKLEFNMMNRTMAVSARATRHLGYRGSSAIAGHARRTFEG